MLKTKKPTSKDQLKAHQRKKRLVIIVLIIITLLLLGLGLALARRLGWIDHLLGADRTAIGISQGADTTAHSSQNSAQSTRSKTNNTKSLEDLKKLIEESGTDPDTSDNDSNSAYDPADVAVEEIFYVDEEIAFSESIIEETNLPRGQQVIAQAGNSGTKRTSYVAKFNSAGRSLAVEKLNEVIVAQPTTQIVKVGISDYNLNQSPTINYFSSFVCLAGEVDAGTCIYEMPSLAFSESFELGGNMFLYYINNYATSFSPAVNVNSSYFTFAGNTYFHQFRYYTGSTATLDESLCLQYGLACGRW